MEIPDGVTARSVPDLGEFTCCPAACIRHRPSFRPRHAPDRNHRLCGHAKRTTCIQKACSSEPAGRRNRDSDAVRHDLLVVSVGRDTWQHLVRTITQNQTHVAAAVARAHPPLLHFQDEEEMAKADQKTYEYRYAVDGLHDGQIHAADAAEEPP